MARFDKLEFNAGQPPSPEPAERDPLVRDAGDWMKKADEERRGGLYESALKYYSRALELDNSLVAGWLGQVQMLVQLEEYPEADLWSRKGLELFPNNGELMAGRARPSAAWATGSRPTPVRWVAAAARAVGLSLAGPRRDHDRQAAGHGPLLFRQGAGARRRLAGPPGSRPHRVILSQAEQGAGPHPPCPGAAPEAHYAWYVQGICQAKLGLRRPRGRVFSVAWSFSRVTRTRRSSSAACRLELVAAEDVSPAVREMTTMGWTLGRILEGAAPAGPAIST